MDSQTPSTPLQRCSSPSPASWSLSALQGAVAALDDARALLHEISLVEGLRDTGRLARGSRDAVDHALEHAHDLIRRVGRTS